MTASATRSRPEGAAGPSSTDRAAGRWLVGVVVAGGAALVVMGFYLWIYRARGFSVPMGWDTSKYLWRTTLGRAIGLSNMKAAVAPPFHGDPQRPGFVVVASLLGSLPAVRMLRLAAVLPAVSAAAIGLASGAFVSGVLRRPAWQLLAVGVGVGTSAFVTRLMGPETYQDNLLAAPILLAALVCLALALRDRPMVWVAAAFFAVGAVVHWAFFVVVGAAVGLTALAYAPGSWRSWRRPSEDGHPAKLLDTPSARMIEAAGAGAVVGVGVVYLVLGADLRPPHLVGSEFVKKFQRDVPKYRLPVILPAAALGVASLASEARRRGEPSDGHDPTTPAGRARFALTVLVSWCAVALVGYLGFRFVAHTIPAHRFLAFSLAVPILAVLGVLWVAGVARARLGRAAGLAAAALLVVGALVASAYGSHVQWFRLRPLMDPAKLAAGATVERYLDGAGVPNGRPIVFVIPSTDGNYVGLTANMLRAALPASRVDDVFAYAGTPENYLARRVTDGPTEARTAVSRLYLDALRGAFGRDPVAFLVRATGPRGYASWVRAHPASEVAPGVSVVQGPTGPRVAPVPAATRPLGFLRLGMLAVAILVLLCVVGLGWLVALVGPRLGPAELVALAPAAGVGALVATGIASDAIGIRLSGVPGVAMVAFSGLAGWTASALRRRRWARRTPPPAGGERAG